ncbi:hypothetical protein [uncultured Oscillibacter sp.]|uniref:hypothetical protein n=1 Tax=uncultured Oscillibacter sp. TaxID=876091 RepID=UPI0025E59B68|nr:hypothetical protein [uncultured Oscillibacter sp.]
MPIHDREEPGKPDQSEDGGKVFIPAKPKVHFDDPAQIFRVCAYCRVSTDSEEQLSSFELQQAHYRQLAKERPNWDLRHVYADERIILGTSQEVLAPQGFPDLVLIFIWPEINGPYGRLIRKCVELSPLPIRRAA